MPCVCVFCVCADGGRHTHSEKARRSAVSAVSVSVLSCLKTQSAEVETGDSTGIILVTRMTRTTNDSDSAIIYNTSHTSHVTSPLMINMTIEPSVERRANIIYINFIY